MFRMQSIFYGGQGLGKINYSLVFLQVRLGYQFIVEQLREVYYGELFVIWDYVCYYL